MEFGIVDYFVDVKSMHYAVLQTSEESAVQATAPHIRKISSTNSTCKLVKVDELKNQVVYINVDNEVYMVPFVNNKEIE